MLAGRVFDDNFEGTFGAVARLKSDGSLDKSFGGDGKVLSADFTSQIGDTLFESELPVLIRPARTAAFKSSPTT